MHALGGLCSQFETTPFVNRRNFSEGEAELMRSRSLVRRAWNIACYTTSAFETSAFNDEVF